MSEDVEDVEDAEAYGIGRSYKARLLRDVQRAIGDGKGHWRAETEIKVRSVEISGLAVKDRSASRRWCVVSKYMACEYVEVAVRIHGQRDKSTGSRTRWLGIDTRCRISIIGACKTAPPTLSHGQSCHSHLKGMVAACNA